MKKIFTFLLCFCTALVVQAGLFDSKPQFLKADDAFQFSAHSNGESLQLVWQIAPDYYLYKKEILLEQGGQKVANLPFPPAEKYQDEFFGETEIYRDHVTLNIPVSSTTPQTFFVTYQGCTKGFCYPPETKTVQWQPLAPNSAEKMVQKKHLNYARVSACTK